MAAQDRNDFEDQFEEPEAGEHEDDSTLRWAIVLWLIAIGGILLLIPIYLLSRTIRQETIQIDATLQAVQATLASQATPVPAVQTLTSDLAAAQERLEEIEEAHADIVTGYADWSAIIAAIGNYDPSELALDVIEQDDEQITLEGRAVDEDTVLAYSQALEDSELFAQVSVESLEVIESPFAPDLTKTAEAETTPTQTVTPTVPPTPTLSPADSFEVDDFRPKPIFLGDPQPRNFYPLYDVDYVQFLAKAGRYYRVSTADLAPGVDTFLTVNVGANTYVNDDWEKGTLASSVSFRTGSSDTQVTVKVSNRGDYGPDRTYQLIAEEFVPTPLPTATATPTPTITPTPENTATSPPTPTATPEAVTPPTPDLRDKYEPNDEVPQSLVPGEVQTHNFYPDQDVDLVEFLAKTGRWYRIYTSNLSPQVDTVLEVTVEDETYQNDDRALGDLSSEVILFVDEEYDLNAQVRVTNRGQYGPDETYQISVEAFVPTPTPTPTSASTNALRPPGVSYNFVPGSILETNNAVAFVIVLELKGESP